MDLWDRLAGGIQEYVENYCLYKTKSEIKPSYEVDYEIDCLDELQKHTTLNDYWLHQISGCKHINDLSEYLQKLIIQYLPRFFEKYPMYKDSECLQKKAENSVLSNLFNEQMTSNEARSVFFKALEGKLKKKLSKSNLHIPKCYIKLLKKNSNLQKMAG